MAIISKKIFIWLPRRAAINYSIIVDSEDVTAYITTGTEFARAMNSDTGTFEINLLDPEKYNNKWVGGETVYLLMDEDDAGTVRFKGKVQKVWPRSLDGGRNVLTLSGAHISSDLINKSVTVEYTNEEYSDMIKDLIDDYTDFTVTNVATTTAVGTVTWEDTDLLDVIKNITEISGYDLYIDNSADTHFFRSGSIENAMEALVTTNLSRMEYFGTDTAEVLNTVIYKGQTDEGLPIVYTATDSSSVTAYGQQEVPVKDTKARTSDEVKLLAESERDRRKSLVTSAKFYTNQLFVTLEPGDKIWISLPQRGIHNQYIVTKFAHRFPEKTSVLQFEEEKTISRSFKNRKEAEKSIEPVLDTGGLGYSWAFPFDDITTNVSSAASVTVVSGALKLLGSATTGTLITTLKDVRPLIAAQCILKASGQDLDASTFEVSLNGGETYKAVSLETLYHADPNVSAADFIQSGNELQIRVTLTSNASNPIPKIGSMVLLYDTV
jgi:hypothetical protein